MMQTPDFSSKYNAMALLKSCLNKILALGFLLFSIGAPQLSAQSLDAAVSNTLPRLCTVQFCVSGIFTTGPALEGHYSTLRLQVTNTRGEASDLVHSAASATDLSGPDVRVWMEMSGVGENGQSLGHGSLPVQILRNAVGVYMVSNIYWIRGMVGHGTWMIKVKGRLPSQIADEELSFNIAVRADQ